MEGGNNQNRCDVCGSGCGHCGKCGNMCGFGGRHLLRWFLGIIIITWVFSIGMKMGEIKAELGNSYSHGYGRTMPMMHGGYNSGAGNMMYTVDTTQFGSTGVKSGTVQIIKGN